MAEAPAAAVDHHDDLVFVDEPEVLRQSGVEEPRGVDDLDLAVMVARTQGAELAYASARGLLADLGWVRALDESSLLDLLHVVRPPVTVLCAPLDAPPHDVLELGLADLDEALDAHARGNKAEKKVYEFFNPWFHVRIA